MTDTKQRLSDRIVEVAEEFLVVDDVEAAVWVLALGARLLTAEPPLRATASDAPTCVHSWLDITTMGATARTYRCGLCEAQRIESWGTINTAVSEAVSGRV